MEFSALLEPLDLADGDKPCGHFTGSCSGSEVSGFGFECQKLPCTAIAVSLQKRDDRLQAPCLCHP